MARVKSFELVPLPFEVLAALQGLGHRIARARAERGYNQRDFADMMGVSPQTLVSLERGAPTVQIGHYARALWMLEIPDASLLLGLPVFSDGSSGREPR
jgi:DNA-binding XRE family transcriptional regulator